MKMRFVFVVFVVVIIVVVEKYVDLFFVNSSLKKKKLN